MIQVLFTLVFAEMVLILSLLFRSPLRQLVIMGLDRSKQGRGPLVVKSVGGTILVFFSSTIYSVFSVQIDAGYVNPTDEVLMAYRLLEASLIGFSIFLALMIDRLHYYIKELYRLRNYREAELKKECNEHSKIRKSIKQGSQSWDEQPLSKTPKA
ncbi:putative B-cell receptor-associated protein 29/31 [Rosa chinensis]|uniref:Endoplasmic reticulum transmembrane protein n=1 Tax=Rosa chinensis TaxID=74649 RepID=A0A2P6QCL6_ROSCH|nr:uncharacterized protein LOC112165164 [Rosa chinensis]PRQ31919.1 putative B-cell receptor-associated protein 29/31 [Rosa chinensis]